MITEETPGPGSTLGEAETTRAGPAQPNSVFEDVEPLRHQPWRSIDGAAGRLLLSTISGALLGAAFPKIGLGGLAWIALVPLLFGIERRSLSKVFGYAWISGTAFFAVSLYWIATALIAESHSSLSVALIAVLAISVFEGVFIAVAIWAAEFVSRQLGISRLLSFPLAWTSFEWLRSWFPVAFPWNPLGNAIYRELPMIQIAEVVGVFGVSALLVAVNVAIWIACSRVAQASACDLRFWIRRLWVSSGRREEPTPRPLPWEGRGVGIEAGTSDLSPRPTFPRERGSFSENHRLKPVPLGAVGLVAVVLGSTFAFGVFKIRQFDHLPVAGRIKVAMVQGNIPQRVKWDPKALPGTFKIYSDASLEAARSHPDLIIWPETATGFLFQPVNFYPAAARVQQEYWDKVTGLAAAAGVPMLIGAPALDIDLNFKQPQSRELPMRNRAYLLGADGRVGEFYDKIELVPVGEYVPAWPLAKGRLHRLVEAPGDFVPGERQVIFKVGDARIAALICYESIFPYLSRDAVRAGANVLVNMTNDAWYGRSSAPYQLLAMTVMRAVENRMPVVRVANTGISAVIDPAGRIVDPTELFTRTTRIEKVSWVGGRTFYTRFGDFFAQLCFALTMLGLIAAIAHRVWLGRGRPR